MKKLFYKMFGIVAAMSVAMFVTACGDDEDEPQNPGSTTQAVATYKVVSDITLSNDYYTFYDVNITYTESDGSEKTVTVSDDFAKTFTFDAASAPAKVVLKAYATPKSGYPEIDPEQTYTLESTTNFTLYRLGSDGKQLSVDMLPNHKKMTVIGSKLKENLDKGNNRTIFTDELTVKQ